MSTINLYGDLRIATMDGHGVDVASQRADDIDRMAIAHIEQLVYARQHPVALDVGCGHGGQAARMAAAGADVVAMDVVDYAQEVAESMNRLGVAGNYRFLQCNVEDRNVWKTIEKPDVIICQRMIHYLSYDSAQRFLLILNAITAPDGLIYLSASGLDSELGDDYPHADKTVLERFSNLAPAMAAKHSILQPVCLYTADELEKLVDRAFWSVEKVFLSPFGNVKLVARKKRGLP